LIKIKDELEKDADAHNELVRVVRELRARVEVVEGSAAPAASARHPAPAARSGLGIALACARGCRPPGFGNMRTITYEPPLRSSSRNAAPLVVAVSRSEAPPPGLPPDIAVWRY